MSKCLQEIIIIVFNYVKFVELLSRSDVHSIGDDTEQATFFSDVENNLFT